VRKLLGSAAAAALALWAAAANAGWSASLDIERFKWEEATEPKVTEEGPRVGFSWEYEQLRSAGWQFAYRGQFRQGTVDYTGSFLFTGGAATARTEYTGVVNEAQGIYRFPGNPYGFELVGGLGWDLWERNILPNQKEDYSVLFLRTGVNFDARANQGWFGGGGLKLPFYVSENAHLDEIGFASNPRLEPQGEVSGYAQLGYRFSPQWSVIGYYDSYRFGESKSVATTNSGFPGTTFNIFQPSSRVDTLGLRVRFSFR
jgi:hypothetical protein